MSRRTVSLLAFHAFFCHVVSACVDLTSALAVEVAAAAAEEDVDSNVLMQTSLETRRIKRLKIDSQKWKTGEPAKSSEDIRPAASKDTGTRHLASWPLALYDVQFPFERPRLEVRQVSQLADINMVISLIVTALLVAVTYKLAVSDVKLQVSKNGFVAKGWYMIIIWLFLALLLLALGTLGLLQGFFEMPYAKGTANVSTTSGVLGYTVWTVLIPVALVLFFTASLEILTDPEIPEFYKSSWIIMLIVFWALVVGAGAYLARGTLGCGIIFCSGSQSSEPGAPNHTGLWVTFVGIMFFLGFLAIAASSKRWHKLVHARASGSASTQSSSILEVGMQRRKVSRLCASVGLCLVVLPTLFLLTTLLPGDMHLDPGSIAQYMATHVQTAELPHAWMITMNVKLSETVILKIFPDTLIFYAFLEILALAAVIAVISPSFGRHLRKKDDPSGFSNGEKYIMILFGVLLCLWVYYWLIDHSYHDGKATIDPWWWERIARTWGQAAVLTMSLLLLPASKNSLWLQALGVSWEQSLWMHRCLGYATLFCMAGHILSFWARFAQLGAFPYDAFAYILYYPINNATMTNPEQPNYDNWTIPNQELIAYPALFMVGIPAVIRRRHYKLFKYFHFVFLALIPAVLAHAASAWYFMLGGVAFWLVDACIRFACVVTPPARLLGDGIIVHEAEDGFTELRMNWTHAEPGQFAWLKVPSISAWEWHPFSLSSARDDGFAQMCIKSMGPGTWTDKLYQLAKQAQLTSSSFDIQVDGPYGTYLDVADHGALLLIAGGIGITQVHSTFRTISQLIARGESFPHLQSVQLVWIGRTEQLFQVFAESLKECVSHSKDELRLSVVLFCTSPALPFRKSSSFPADAALPMKVLSGRPSFSDLYTYGISAAKSKTLLVQACGPEAMIEASAEAARGFKQVVFESMLFTL